MGLISGGAMGGLVASRAIAPALELETTAYFAAMAAASEPYWPSEVALIDNYIVKPLKSAGLWGRPKLLWIPVGASLSGAMRALKHPLGVGTVMTNNGFTVAKWDRLVGLDSQDGIGWIGTQTTAADYAPNTSTHIALDVVRAGSNAAGSRDAGIENEDLWHLVVKYQPTLGGYYRSSAYRTYDNIPLTEPSVLGVHVSSQTPTTFSAVHNNTVRASGTSTPSTDVMSTTNPIGIFRASNEMALKTFAYASFGSGFTLTEALQYSAIMQAAKAQRAALTPG